MRIAAVLLLGVGTAMATPRAAPVAAGAIDVPACPARIAVEQSVAAPAGWTTDRTRGSGRFSALTFYDGPVASRAQLRETDQRRRGATLTTIWSFAGHRSPIHVACLYGDTDIVLSRALPAGVRECTSSEDAVTHAVDPAPSCR